MTNHTRRDHLPARLQAVRKQGFATSAIMRSKNGDGAIAGLAFQPITSAGSKKRYQAKKCSETGYTGSGKEISSQLGNRHSCWGLDFGSK
jgi:hypothetical protein